jgi:hypothetical protein
MIEKTQFLEILVQACPTFSQTRDEHIVEFGNDVLFVAAGEFSRHLLTLQRQGATSYFSQVGVTIEKMYATGTPEVKELATIGILEGIQNIWANNDINPEFFLEYLGTEGRAHWRDLNDFWSGKAPQVRNNA